MPTVEERLDYIEKVLQNVLTRSQVEALVAALGQDHTTILQRVGAVETKTTNVEGDMSTLKDRIEDHETRIDTLEGP